MRLISFGLFLLMSSLAFADRAILGYSPASPYAGPVIVYTYTTADGGIGLSHCQLLNRENLNDAFSSYTSLNLNTCDLSYQPPHIIEGTPSVQVNPPTPLAF